MSGCRRYSGAIRPRRTVWNNGLRDLKDGVPHVNNGGEVRAGNFPISASIWAELGCRMQIDRFIIDDDSPVPLKDAVTLFFPYGGLTLASLRTEVRKKRLVVEEIAGKHFVTRRAINDMRAKCRAEGRPLTLKCEPRTESASGSSEMDSGTDAQDALRRKLGRLTSRPDNQRR